MMRNNNFKYKKLKFGLLLMMIWGQLGCGDFGDPTQNSSYNSNVANSSISANTNNSANLSIANNVNKIRNGSTGRSEQVYSGMPEIYPENQEMPNSPTLKNSNDTMSQQMAENSGTLTKPPIIINNGRYPSGTNAPKSVERMPNTPVMLDLESAIDRWSETEAASYGLRATLISLWRRKNPTIKYNPVGIDVLTNRIKERPAFLNCARARQLSRAMFNEDGIVTVGHLYDYLEPCGN